MILDELKAAVQPLIDDDFDAVYTRFMRASGTRDLGRFLSYLKDQGTLSGEEIGIIREVYPELAEDGTLAPQTPAPRSTGRAPTPRPTSARRPTSPSEPRSSQTWREPGGKLPKGLRRAGRTTGGGGSTGAAVDTPKSGGRSTGGSSFVSSTGDQRDKPLIGRGYKMIGDVGEGAMGKVLLARDLDLARTVAYKEMSPEIARKPQLSGKFYCEAQITAQLDHPNIVPIYALDEGPDGRLAYSMKLIRGQTLEDLINTCITLYDNGARRLDDEHELPLRLDIFLKVCDAIHYAHNRGVIHRDLKPENIMIGPYGEVYVMDWGIAKVLEPPGDASNTAWVTLDVPAPEEGEVVIGTPQYMSPEQAEGKTATLTYASDQYALGLILFELVSLNQAVTGKTPMAIVMKQQDAYKEKLVHYARKKIPTEMRAIIDKATHREPDQRYPSIHELSEDVRRYLRGDAVSARPDGALQSVLRWISKHRELTLFGILAGGFLSAMVIVSGVAVSYYQRTVDQARQERLSEVLSAVGTQAARVDGQFVKYEGLLGIMAASASEMLGRHSQDSPPVYFSHAFDDPTAIAPGTEQTYADTMGLLDSSRYGQPVSLEYPVFVRAPGMGADVALEQAQHLEPLRRYQRRILLRSHSEEAAASPPRRAQRLILELGVPIAWMHVGLKNGLYVGYPGHGGYNDRFDPREQPWYSLVTGSDGTQFERGVRGPQWGAPYVDPTGLGRILPSAMAIVTDEDQFAGVAAVELTFDYVIDELMEIPELQGKAEAFLLDESGRIVVRSSQRSSTASGATTRTLRMPTFHIDGVVDAITTQGRRSGYMETEVNGDDTLIVWQRMHSLGWFYVVEGDSKTLLRR